MTQEKSGKEPERRMKRAQAQNNKKKRGDIGIAKLFTRVAPRHVLEQPGGRHRSRHRSRQRDKAMWTTACPAETESCGVMHET